MRFLSYLVTLLFASLMAACGGGGGSPGTIVGPEALAVNAPAALTQLVGTAQSFAITGGQAPFTALSNNELVARAGVTGGTLTIFTAGVGTATIVVRDAFGATVNVPLTSAVAQPLSTTAGSAITIEMGATQSFRIVGGAPGYTATSGNTNIAAASALGSTLTITGIKPGSTTVLVRDGVGTTVNIAVTVTTVGNLALFTTAPTSLTVPIGGTSVFSVGGGLAPFAVSSSNPGVATVTLIDSTLTIQGIRNGTASINIRDSLGTALPAIAVTVPAPDALFSSASSAVTIGIGSHADFTVGGGLGAKLVSSSNVAVAIGTLDSSGTTLTITGVSAGTANIQIRDTFGTAPLIIAVTVPSTAATPLFTTAPAGLTIAINSSPTFTIGGGTPGSAGYTVTSSNTAVATGTISGSTTLIITGISAGNATLVVRDSVGATVNVPVIVAGSSVALFTSAPSPVTVPLNTTSTFSVGGGTGVGYTAVSSNPGVATASLSGTVSGSNLLVHGVSPGSAIILITDSGGHTVSLTVNVPNVSSSPLFTTAPSAGVTLQVGSPITYIVSGGTSPYFVTSDNTTVANVSPATATSTYTITPVTVGTANVQIRDAANAVLTVPVTVIPATSTAVPLTSTAPSTVTIAAGTTQTYTVSGGTGTYTITNTNPFDVGATITGAGPTPGGTLTLSGLIVGSPGSTITIRDAAGTPLVITVNVIVPGSTLQLLPGSLTVSERTVSFTVTPIDLSVFGGSGSYTAFTSNLNLTSVSIVPGPTTKLRIAGGTSGNECVTGNAIVTVTVVDSLGAIATSTLNIVDIVGGGGGCPP
jgi:hypothetical protein